MMNVDEGGAPDREPRLRVRAGSAPRAGDEPMTPVLTIKTIFAQFWPYTRPYRKWMALALGLGLCLPVLQAVTIWMFKILTDDVLVPHDLAAFWPVAGAYVGITVAVGVISFGSSYLSRWLAQHFALDLRTDLFTHLHSLSLDVLDNRRLGDVLSRLTSDVTAVRRLVVSGISRSLRNVLRVILFTVALFVLQWQLALVAIAVAPLFVLTARLFATRIKFASRQARHHSGAMTALAEESLGNAPLVQAYQQQDAEVSRFHAEGRAKLTAQLHAAWLSAEFGPLVQVVELVGVLAVIGLGTWQLSEGMLTLGGLLAFVGFVSQLYSPIRSLSQLSNTIFSATAGAERISELFSMTTSVPEAADATDLGRASGRVVFDAVVFSYGNDRFPALRGVSFTAESGQAVGIAGPSGAGKSTIAKLTTRLYDVSAGRVLIDGHDVRDLTISSLRANVSLLLQETLVFHGSIYDNISYGRPNATAQDVYAAARAAEVDGFVAKLPDGYDTVVGERGRSLSGGQRQRIAIARALVRDAPILVLDEPTTGLDDGTGKKVLTALNRLMAGRTTIVIAHDEQSLALADRRVHLDRGHLTGSGPQTPKVSPTAPAGPSGNEPVAAGETLVPGYVVDAHLNRSETLDVYSVWSSGRRCSCIVKVLRPDCRDRARDLQQLACEGRLLIGYTHPHLVRGYEMIDSETIGPVVVMETLPGATLSRLIIDAWPFDDDDIALLGRQLVSILQYIHDDGIVHLDLKPSNIVCDAGIARVIDLSLARPIGTRDMKAGTYEYKAPEQVVGDPVGPATDVWGLGGVLYRMATGRRPFPRGQAGTCSDRQPDQLPDLELLRGDPRLTAVIRACFSLSPEDRPSLTNIDHTLVSVAETVTDQPDPATVPIPG